MPYQRTLFFFLNYLLLFKIENRSFSHATTSLPVFPPSAPPSSNLPPLLPGIHPSFRLPPEKGRPPSEITIKLDKRQIAIGQSTSLEGTSSLGEETGQEEQSPRCRQKSQRQPPSAAKNSTKCQANSHIIHAEDLAHIYARPMLAPSGKHM